ncbi:MAG: polyphosphate kinase 1 [Gammaproteobacteria bacterium]|nr:polyphosphate kinase 1 [Gammaproteobacteria bacterium]
MNIAHPTRPPARNLNYPKYYVNRELSLLEFNRRVIQQARNEKFPLLERLRFVCIASSNLDEFFEIRVAGLQQRRKYGQFRRGPDGMTVEEQLAEIARVSHELVDEQYEILNEILIPRLREQEIYFLKRGEWNAAQTAWVEKYFRDELLPILNPIGLDPAHPFPPVTNKSLNFIVGLDGKDAFGRNVELAVVQAPRSSPRVIQLPPEIAYHEYDFVLLSSVIHANVAELFAGMDVKGCHQFRFTRDSDLLVDEEEATDLLLAVEGELSTRRFGDTVRLEIAKECPSDVVNYLRDQFDLADQDVYLCTGPVNLMRLNQLPDLVDKSELKFPAFSPGVPKRIQAATDMFEAIREGDLLLHHPYQSFIPVLDLLRQAAIDPNVISIRQTLYRTGQDSAVVKALIDASNNGKEVMVAIELRARFDEAENIELAQHLTEAGVQVVFGLVGYKTHAKMMLIIRREGKHLKRYAHLGTGNYHPRTTRQYTDCGMLTCDPAITEDVLMVFKQLTSKAHPSALQQVIQSPFSLYDRLVELINREIQHVKEGRAGRLIAKMNSLEEPGVIRALYRASQAGVEIDLIVRGICCLRPGIPGVSANIRVRSIVGRFLEHTRIFYFQNDGDSQLFMSSADWMTRNIFNRVELAFPARDAKLAQTILRDGLEIYLKDNSQAWEMQSDGSYTLATVQDDEARVNAQETLLRLMRR